MILYITLIPVMHLFYRRHLVCKVQKAYDVFTANFNRQELFHYNQPLTIVTRDETVRGWVFLMGGGVFDQVYYPGFLSLCFMPREREADFHCLSKKVYFILLSHHQISSYTLIRRHATFFERSEAYFCSERKVVGYSTLIFKPPSFTSVLSSSYDMCIWKLGVWLFACCLNLLIS